MYSTVLVTPVYLHVFFKQIQECIPPCDAVQNALYRYYTAVTKEINLVLRAQDGLHLTYSSWHTDKEMRQVKLGYAVCK